MVKKYGLVWEQQTERVIEQLKTNKVYLEEDESLKIAQDPDNPKYNVIIEGDNYEALTYMVEVGQKVDVIYIDPPYNTGNNGFIYNDKFINKDDEYSHSKWLSFMDARLRLARELYEKRQEGDYDTRDWCWTLSRKEFDRRDSLGDIVFKNTKNGWRVYYKSYYANKKSPYEDIYEGAGNQVSSNEIKDLFDGRRVFDYSKPINYVKHLINLHPNKNATVLDFFAGSGTTGHAVLKLNKEDGGNRQFILVTNNENNIARDITYERNKRVIEGYTTPKGKDITGIPSNLAYYRTKQVPK